MTKSVSATAMRARRTTQGYVVVVAGLGLLAVTIAAVMQGGLRHGLVAPIGLVAGIALYHAAFGFTSAWRRILTETRSVGLRAQLVMIGLTIIVFFPLLERGAVLGQPVIGFISPIGVALSLGAFLFGIGMQLGGGCGSGTLYAAGSGSVRMAVTLAAFIAGSLVATANPLDWQHWTEFGSFSIIERIGAAPAIAVSLACLALVYIVVQRMEHTRHGAVQVLWPGRAGDLLRGPWPLIGGAVALAVVNVATLVVAGRPWGITAAFALWGAKFAAAIGADVGSWSYWRGDLALDASLFADVTSVMNFGLMLGALAAAGLAGRFEPRAKLPPRSLLAAIIGGLLMGIGARLATGCNIGAFFSGVASGSLHGLVWLIFAAPGNAVGVRLRPLFRLDG